MKLIFVMTSNEYHTRSEDTPDGWLGFLIGGHLWYPIWGDSAQIVSTAQAIAQSIGNLCRLSEVETAVAKDVVAVDERGEAITLIEKWLALHIPGIVASSRHSYAVLFYDEGKCGCIDRVMKKVLKDSNWLSGLGIDEDDAEDILEAINKDAAEQQQQQQQQQHDVAAGTGASAVRHLHAAAFAVEVSSSSPTHHEHVLQHQQHDLEQIVAVGEGGVALHSSDSAPVSI